MNTKARVVKSVKKDDIEEAINILLNDSKYNSALYLQIVLLSAQYEEIKRESRLGTPVPPAERNRIRKAVLELAKEIDEDTAPPSYFPPIGKES